MPFTNVPGRDADRKVKFLALSTCAWCRKTKELLDEIGVAYDYVYTDLAPDDEWQQLRELMKQLNPRGSYPVVTIGSEVVIGYQPERIRELLGC
jgi:glutaredoxin